MHTPVLENTVPHIFSIICLILYVAVLLFGASQSLTKTVMLVK